MLVLISYHWKNSKRLEGEVKKLIYALTVLNKKELQELDKITQIEKGEKGIFRRFRKIKTSSKNAAKAEPKTVKSAVTKMLNEAVKKKNVSKSSVKKSAVKKKKPKKNEGLIKAVDKFLRRWKK